MADKITNLYNAFVNNGYAMESEAQFRENLRDQKKRKAAYDALVKDGYNMEPFADFESNIGYAPKPQAAPNPQPQQQTMSAAPVEQTTPAPAPQAKQEQPAQPRWQPTEQEKIRMSYQRNAMLNDFDKKSRARVEQVKRMTEQFTPEGRKKLEAKKFQAQLAGTPTHVMGLTPPTQAPAAEGRQGNADEAARQQPIQSGRSPVPYGVKYVDGKPVTEWLLPDGGLTTSLMEADQAEYSARTVRMRHEFEERMKRNGLDPAKQEDVMLQTVNERLAENEAKLKRLYADRESAMQKKESGGGAWDRFVATVGGGINRSIIQRTPQREENLTDEERDVQNLLAENDMLEEARRTLKSGGTLKKSEGWLNGLFDFKNNVRNFVQGAADKLNDVDLYAGGIMALHKSERLDKLNTKLKNGEELTDSELSMAYSAILNRDVAESIDLPHGYKAAQTTVEMIPFMVQMAANPASGLSRGLVRKYGKSALKRILLTAGGDVAEAAVLANTLQAPKSVADIKDRHRGEIALQNGVLNFEDGQSWVKAIAKGEGAAVIENYTELLGSHFGGIFGGLSKGVSKGARKIGLGKAMDSVGSLISNVKASDWGKAIANIESRAQWNGTLGEVLEEEAGIILNSIFVGDNKLSDLTDSKQQIDILLGVGLFGGFVSGIKTVGYPIDRAMANRRLNSTDKIGAARFGTEKWNEIKSIIENAEDKELSVTVSEIISNNCEYNHQAKDIIDYAHALVRARGYNLAKEARRQEEMHSDARGDARVSASESVRHEAEDEVEVSYMNGAETYGRFEEGDPTAQAEADAIAIRMQEAYQGVEDAFGAESEYYMFHLNENPWDLLNDPELTAEQQDAVLYYINTKAALDGVMDASNEAADRKRTEVEQAVQKRTHRDSGVIIPATMKVDHRPVYIVKGDVVMFPDGTGVDIAKTLERNPTGVIYYTDESGEVKPASPDQIFKVSEALDPQEEVRAAHAIIEQEQVGIFRGEVGKEEENSVTLQHGNRSEQDNDELPTGDDGGSVATYSTGSVEGDRDRSDIRVYEEGLETSQREHSEYGERTRRDAEAERLIGIAKTQGRYIEKRDFAAFGNKVEKRSGESEVYIDEDKGRVYKVKDPAAKSPMKGNVQPEDAIYEHLVHNKYFPETRYQFEGISDEMGDLRIVLSQGYIDAVDNATEGQIADALAEKGLYPEGNYRYGNDEVSVTDMTGDNALLGADGKVYFIDPIIDFKKPVREILGDDTEENGPEADATVQNGQETALSRIPLHPETNEPMFEAVDKETAWDGLVEAIGGNEKGASDIAMAQIAQASADLEALQKKPPTKKSPKLKGSPMAMAAAMAKADEDYNQAVAEYQKQVADTQARLDAWNGIVSVYTSRNAELRRQREEERRQRDAEAHDAAVAQFEEQQRIKAERQAEQERVGVHAVNPKIKDKWDSAPKIEGNPDAITLPDGSAIRGRYVLTEAGAASASHDINNAYEPTEGFPVDTHGQSVNDRDYLRDKDAQRIVEQMAGAYDNRALQTPVIVSQDGVVLSGNNRTMSGDLAARHGTDKAYVEYLSEFGLKYGFTPEQVAGMKNPRLLFVPDETLPYDATTLSRFNAQEMKSQSKPEAAVKLGKIVPDDVFNGIAGDIARYDRLGDYYADEKAVARALGALMQAGVINDKQMPEMRTGTALSASGRELIENTLIGKVFQASPDAVRQIVSMPTLRQSIVMGLNEVAGNRTLAKQGYDLSNELGDAVELVHRAKSALPDVYVEGMPVSPFGRQQGLFDDEFGDSRVTDGVTLLLADVLNSGKPSDLRKMLTAYNNEAAISANGQIDMFSGSVPTKEDLLTNINEYFRNATPREQQALVDAAIAERKRRAEAEAGQHGRDKAVEQAADVVQSGSEPQQPTDTGLEPLAKDRDDFNEDTPEEATLRARISVGDENIMPIDGTKSVESRSGNLFDYFTGSLNELIGKAKEGATGLIKKIIAPISGRLRSDLSAKGVEIDEGYNHVIDNNAIRHTLKNHGGKSEEKRGQIPITDEDFSRLEDVVTNYDNISVEKGKRGNDNIIYSKTYEDGTTIFVEENRVGRKELAAVTMWKKKNPTRTDANHTEATQISDLSRISDGKENTLSADKQILGEESSQQSSDDKDAGLERPSVQASVQAVSAEVNTEPTEAQKRAGNYKMEHRRVDGYDISIENKKGSIRRGKDANGAEWESEMHNDYGYIRGTEGVDGDHIDVFLSDAPEQGDVFVIDQYNPDGAFDEHKVMYGFADSKAAMDAYLANYEQGWEQTRRLDVTGVSKDEFKKWVKSSKRKTKPFADYKNVTPIDEAKFDNQGNPIDENGNLIIEKVESVDAITDKDFTEPYRTVGLPPLPEKVADAIGLQGSGPIIKKNVFDKNKKHHKDLTPEDGRIILNQTLYNPQLYGQNQKTSRPYNWILVHLADKNSAVVVEVNNPDKDNAEIVNWHYIGGEELERKKRQAVKEGGLILTLSEDNAAADTHDDLLSNGKVNTLSSDKQASAPESSAAYTITPASYTNKKGKETPMHRLEFGRELTKEQESAVKAFASEKQGEGRFAPARGWKDRENGGWLFRTEEDARKAAELVGNEEASNENSMTKFRDGESEGERLLAIRGLEPIEVESNNLSKSELQEIYRNLPSVEKDGREVEFYHNAFKKIYKEGGLFGQIVPVLDEVLEQSVLAYSEEDDLGGLVRPDGTVHKTHPNIDSFDNYVGKVSIAGKDYYVRTTVQHSEKSSTGTHSFMVTRVDIYENTANGLSLPITTRARGTNDGIVDAKLQQFFERASAELLSHDMRARAIEISEKLNTPIRLVDSANEAMENPSARHRRAKGWATDKEIVVVVPNNVNVADIENTVVHEVVGHKGLRALIGEDRFDEFLGEVYDHASNPIRKVIDKKVDEMVNAEADRLRVRKGVAHDRAGEDVNANYYTDMASARVEAEKKREQFRREATEEYMSDLGGRIGSEGFEKMSRDELTLWGKIKAKVQQFLDKFLQGLKIAKSIRLNDKDLAYILYKSWKNMRNEGKPDVFDKAEDVVMRRKTGYDRTMFADGVDKKNTARSEAALKHLEPSSNGGRNMTGREARLNDLDPASNHDAKVIEKLEIAKAGLYQVAEAYKSETNPRGFLTDLGKSIGIIMGHSGSGYRTFELKDGRILKIRLSTHNANAENAKTGEPVVSMAIKPKRTPNTFVSDENKVVDEYVYFKEDIRKAPAGTLSSIAESISELLDTGEYIDRTGLARENHSPESGKIRFRDGDDLVAKRPVMARAMYEQRVASSAFQVREAMQDSMAGLFELYRAIDKASGVKRYIEEVPDYQSAYLEENRMTSMNKAWQDAYERLFIKPMLEEVVKLAPDEKTYGELVTYMMAKHGVERNALMRERAKTDGMDSDKADATDFAGLTGLFMTDDVVDAETRATQLVSDYEAAHDTAPMWDKINAATKATLSKLKEGGLMSKESHDKIADMYDNYIPLRGWSETTTDEVYGYVTRQDASLRGSVLKTANGRTSIADDPIATIAMMGQQAIAQANRNKMKQAFLTYVMKNPSDLVSVSQLWLQKNDVTDEWEPVFASNINEGDDPATVERKIHDFEETMKRLAAADPDKYKSGRQARGIPYKIGNGNLGEHTVLVKRGDYTYVVTINGNPRAAQALNGLTNPDVGTGVGAAFFGLGEKINHIISPIYTTRNPDFMVGNFMRDAFYGNIMTWIKESPRYAGRLNLNFIRVNPARMVKLISRYNSNKLDMSNPLERQFHEFIINGGETGYTNQADIEKQKKQVKKMQKRLRSKFSFGRFMDCVTAKWDVLNSAAENAMRFAVYLTSRQEGRTILRSVYDAKEVSVNFNKKGAGAKFMGATGQTMAGNTAAFVSGTGRGLYVFWNATVQAVTNFFRNAKRHPYKMTGAMIPMFLMGAMQAIVGAFDDDDEGTNDKNRYFDLPDYVRRSNLLLRVGDQFLAHPLPHEYLSVFGMGEMAATLLMGKDEMSAGEIALNIASMMSEFSPLPIDRAGWDHALVPSSIKPLYEALINESWTGMPIYKSNQFNTDMPEWTKAYSSANHLLVNLSERLNAWSGGDKYTKGAIDFNPAQVEYVLNGYLGGYFKMADRMMKMYETAIGEREFEWRNMPLANRVVKQGDERTANRRVTNDYFEYMTEYDRLNKRIRNYEREAENNVLEYAEKLAELTRTPEFRRYWIIKGVKSELDAIDRDLKEAETEDEINVLTKERDAIREQLVKKIRHTIPVEEADTAGIGVEYDNYKSMGAQ